jgi:hypothetical protein
MALADRDVVADARLHLDVMQPSVRALQDKNAAPANKGLGLDLGVMQLQAEALARVDVDQLGRVRRILRR